jgi:hypothetical protein
VVDELCHCVDILGLEFRLVDTALDGEPMASEYKVLTDDLQAFRRLNAVTVPLMVGVPKDKEEDMKRGNP